MWLKRCLEACAPAKYSFKITPCLSHLTPHLQVKTLFVFTYMLQGIKIQHSHHRLYAGMKYAWGDTSKSFLCKEMKADPLFLLSSHLKEALKFRNHHGYTLCDMSADQTLFYFMIESTYTGSSTSLASLHPWRLKRLWCLWMWTRCLSWMLLFIRTVGEIWFSLLYKPNYSICSHK